MNAFVTAFERGASIVKNKLFQSNEEPKRLLNNINNVNLMNKII